MGVQWTLQFLCAWGAQPSLQSALPCLGGDSDIQCVLQDCGSPESNGSLEPKRPGGSEAASGSQEKLDFNRNLKEGKKSALVRDRDLGQCSEGCSSSLWSLLVVPAIEKLLSSDWKDRFLGRSSVESKDVKGEGHGVGRGASAPSPSLPMLSGPGWQLLGFLVPSDLACATLAPAWP